MRTLLILRAAFSRHRLLAALAACAFAAAPVVCLRAQEVAGRPAGSGSVPTAVRQSAPVLTGYRPVLGLVRGDGRTEIALRAWTEDGRGRLLLADPATLRTRVAEGSVPAAVGWAEAEAAFAGTDLAVRRPPVYFRLRQAARRTREKAAGAGIASWTAARRGAWLSVDLCPSRKPLDRWIFAELEKGRGAPLPVFIDVSGAWIAGHQDDFRWLAGQARAGRLDIVWVGHGEEHPYDRTVSENSTFDLTPGLDFAEEVFATERRLLAAGEVPSVWYRFPGLMSSPALVDSLFSWGLLPLSADAWLAKGERAADGSIVLVHANGNEPTGLALLRRLAADRALDLAAGRWSWLSLEDFAAGR